MTFATEQAFDETANGSSGELLFSDLLERYLVQKRAAKRCAPRFSALYREVPATVGVADFVGLVDPRWRYTRRRLETKLGGLPRAPVAEILSRFGRKRHMHRDEIAAESNYTTRVMTATLHALGKADVVVGGADQGYALNPKFVLPKSEIYFYEVKMKNWARALFQATQAKSYADKSYCVMPESRRQVLLDNREWFRRAGVGAMLFDPSRWTLIEIIPARKTAPKRQSSKLDVLIRLSTAVNLITHRAG